jgi:anion-transporting  ArsA/GET3 family ATPase
MKSKSLEGGLREARVLVCAGTGGVGKTTISAALAIQAACRGRRTLVLTIDPARRLADALGLESLGPRPAPVDLSRMRPVEGDFPEPSLQAMMLDPKPTFDRLIERLTPDESARRRILDNRIYQHLSQALAGSAEYAAMEQVHELVHSGDYDLVVVDTPPADHALDFLRAPRRLREFLDSRFVHALVRPAMSASRFGMRFFARPLHRMFHLLERIAGVGFLDDLSEFLSAIDGLSQGFQDRATAVENVLLGKDTGFVLVCGSHSSSTRSTLEFLSQLDEFGVPLIAVIANRVRPWPLDEAPSALLTACQGEALARDEERLREAWGDLPYAAEASEQSEGSNRPADAARVTAAVLDYARICAAGQRSVASLNRQAALHHVRCHSVPDLAGDIDHFEALVEIGSGLCAPAPEPPPRIST